MAVANLRQSGNIVGTNMKNRNALIGWELVLLFASVLVFRSAWLLLDEMKWARTPVGLWALLVPGVALSLLALRAIQPEK